MSKPRTQLSALCFVILFFLGIVSSKPMPVLDDGYFSFNEASLSNLGLLDKRVDCGVNSVYCAAYGTYCLPGSTCCYANCCNAGYACYTDGYCYPDVVYTYCYTTTWSSTSSSISYIYSTLYSTSQYTSTSWSTTTTTVRSDVATTTVWVTVQDAKKRDEAPKTTYNADSSTAITLIPTSPTRYEMRDSAPGVMIRRKLETIGLLDKRTTTATITVVVTTTFYSYLYSTSYYTQTITSGSTTILSTTTSTFYDGAGSTFTVTSTRRAGNTAPPDLDGLDNIDVKNRSTGLSTGAKAGIGVGSATGCGLILLIIGLLWREKRKRAREEKMRRELEEKLRREREENARRAREEKVRIEQEERSRLEQAEVVRKKELADKLKKEEETLETARKRALDENLQKEADAKKRQELVDKVALSIPKKQLPPYDALPLGPNQIRILIVHAAAFSDRLECTLERISIDDRSNWAEKEYDALSYVWRQVPDSDYFTLEGKIHVRSSKTSSFVPLDVGPNLELAIRHLRQEDLDRAIWNDQICVEQAFPLEVDKQMELMRSIYKNAAHVIAWLGENESGVGLTIGKAKLLGCIGHKVPRELAESGQSLLEIDPEADKTVREVARGIWQETETEEDIQTFTRIIGLPFWSRRWILQEVTLAGNLFLQIGHEVFSWRDLLLITEVKDPERIHRTDDFHVVVNNTRAQDEDILLNSMRRRIRPVEILRFLWHLREEKKLTRFCLLDLVQALRNWECEVPIDVVNAVIGLIRDEDLQMNKPSLSTEATYQAMNATMSEHNLCEDITKAYEGIFKNKRISVIKQFCGMIEVYGRLVESHALKYHLLDGLNSHTGERYPHMPSWIPNFHVPNSMYSLIEGVPNNPVRWLIFSRPVFTATKGTEAIVSRFGSRSQFLKVYGRLFDEVDCITTEGFQCSKVQSVDLASQKLQAWAAKVSPTIDSWGPGRYPSNFDEAIRFISVGGLTTRREPDGPEVSTRATLTELYHDHLPYSNGAFHGMSLRYEEAVFRAQHGRRPFRTKMGFVGIGPAHMRRGDSICLLNGGQTPYIIRPGGPDDYPNSWTFIGECYIHGIMNGEAMGMALHDEMRLGGEYCHFIFN